MVKVYEYKSYQEYVDVQTRENKKKLGWVYAHKDVMRGIHKVKPMAGNILCHGVRNGKEMTFFSSYYPHAKIQGTEISETATQFKNTIQWDFQEVKEEWIGKWDIVYSNSYDHAIKPVETLAVWRDQLAEGGSLFLEYSEKQSIGNENDPLDATLDEVITMVKEAGFQNVKILNGIRAASAGSVIRGDK